MGIHQVSAGGDSPHDQELRRYVRQLTRSLARMDHHLAEDLEQDAWVSTLQEGQVDRGSKRAWIRAVVRHRFLNIRNRRHSTPKVEPLSDGSLASARDDPARLAAEREVGDAVRASLGELPDIYAFAVSRRFLDGARPIEIAEELGVSIETIRTRLRRGLHRLRAKSPGADSRAKPTDADPTPRKAEGA